MPNQAVYIAVDTAGERDIPALADRVNAAAKAALDWGADRVAVAGDPAALDPSCLPMDAEYIPTRLPCGGLDAGFTAVVLMGPSGEPAGWSHRSIAAVRVGGLLLRDPGALTALAGGSLGVPVAAVVGGDRFVGRMRDMMPETEGIVTANRLQDGSPRLLHPNKIHRQVADGLRLALRRTGEIPPLTLHEPVACEVSYLGEDRADIAALIPGVAPIDGCTVGFTGSFDSILPILSLLLCHL